MPSNSYLLSPYPYLAPALHPFTTRNLESPLDCKEIQPVYPKGDQSWVFIGRTDVEAETPVIRPPDVKSWLIGKDSDAGKDWGQAEKGTTEDEMVAWHHWTNRHGFGWTLGVGDVQGGLACYSLWGHKESDATEWLNWTELKPGLCNNLEMRESVGGGREGTYVHLLLIHVNVW